MRGRCPHAYQVTPYQELTWPQALPARESPMGLPGLALSPTWGAYDPPPGMTGYLTDPLQPAPCLLQPSCIHASTCTPSGKLSGAHLKSHPTESGGTLALTMHHAHSLQLHPSRAIRSVVLHSTSQDGGLLNHVVTPHGTWTAPCTRGHGAFPGADPVLR